MLNFSQKVLLINLKLLITQTKPFESSRRHDKTMNNIIITGTHPVFLKTAEEETELFVSGSDEERFYYICSRGIQTLSGQQSLLGSNEKWIKLQQMVHPEMWNYRLYSELRQRGVFPPDDRSEEKIKADFLKWLKHNMMCSQLAYKSEEEFGRTSQALLAAGARFSKPLSEEEEIALLESKDWERVQNYARKWKPQAEKLFFSTAPAEHIFAYIRFFGPQTVEAEKALIFRGDSVLTWELVLMHQLSYEASRIIKNSGNPYIWKMAVERNYTFAYRFERKFGSIRNWKKQLGKSFDRKYFKHNT